MMSTPHRSAPGAPPARPRIPGAPVLSRASFGGMGAARPLSVLDAGAARLVTSGRIAIALALREMKVKPGDTVLVPAYHSPSMIPPVLACGAEPRFYRIRPDTSVDLDDVAARLDPSVRVLMVTHYFGFPQALATLRAFCDAHGLLLLEDCAHGFFGEYQGAPFGAWGDYAIASSMKFFPIYEGGCLVSARHPLSGVKLRSPGAGFEAKVALTTLENSFAYGRLPLVAALLKLPLAGKDRLWRALKARRAPGSAAPALAPGSSDSSYDFDPRWLDKRSSLFSRLMLRLASSRRIGAARRRHYAALQAALAGLPGIRPLFPALPDGVYPWVFPLLADEPARLARLCAALGQAGVPYVRFGETLWPGVDASVCAVSADLSQRLVALPCHQALTARELDWMLGELRAASTL
ncbi:aminotransferase class I/II-fold pyridoxal phosphate-dependent enzyme [Massilia sp. LXY-6]|uniref:aminotransferase class I/II-fold pyridoxal phosphate-dependent enzyme n=1 Tax=Massilia sp. LXY-6 TaxID=3379823 RepID=UPI003EDEB6FE